MKKLLATVLVFGSGAAMAGNEFLVVSEQAKAGGIVSLDFASDGTGTGVEARIAFGEEKVSVDTSKCLAGLPKTHTGSCVYNGKELVVLVYSMTNALLPEGMLELGSVRVRGSLGKASGKPTVESLVVGSPQAQQVSAKAAVE
jgi:hypothetical protein